MSQSVNRFLTQAATIAEKNIQLEKYSIEEFARDLFMSKSSLSKKMRAMVGITPLEFIENVKFKFALELLKDAELTIKEIAYSSGFNDPKYFSRRFKKIYGMSPRDYKCSVTPKTNHQILRKTKDGGMVVFLLQSDSTVLCS